MEEIYVNVDPFKPVHQTSATDNKGSISTRRRLFLGVLISLGVLNVLLLAGLVVFVIRSLNLAAELSTKDNLTEHLQISNDKLSSMTEERDLLTANLTELNKRLIMLQHLSNQKKACPSGWTMFSYSCYFFSTRSASWDEGRKDCRDRGADLIVVDDNVEQTFLTQNKKEVWIGLTDKETEGFWKWVDGTPFKESHWERNQPDNGNGDPEYGEEDCVHYRSDTGLWNDISCASSKYWLCEKNL